VTLADVLAACRNVARLDAQLLLLHVLGRSPRDRAWLLAHDDHRLDAQLAHRFEQLCARRAGGEPLAYLVGEKEFHGLTLQVDARVLVPRPDTETLVDWTLDVLADQRAPRVLDLGTGSGAIALAIKNRRPDVSMEAVDRSADALAVARANAQSLGLNVAFRQASWLDGAARDWHLIVSNPPYVAAGDDHLADLEHEPRQALVAGADGLDDLRTIITTAPRHLATGGWLLLEHGWDQASAVRALLAAAGFSEVASRLDLAGIERCSGGRWLEGG